MPQHICLLNDSFPPLIDGVANAVVNYATYLHQGDHTATVMTPAHPEADDSSFPFPVVRYPSIDTRKLVGYMTGAPFSPEITRYLSEHPVDLLHSHCPIVSTLLSRSLRPIVKAPVVFTYHTRFDVDIATALRGKLIQDGAIHALAQNISACDEVWVVSRGAGENLRSLGYQGDYLVMPNGVDMPRGRVDDALVAQATDGYDLPFGVPVFLFVGRLVWYKGIRIILDALAALRRNGIPFRMVFIGTGTDEDAIRDYTQQLGLSDSCLFTGAIRNRERLRAWYCRADLFLFPSVADTNGLVVREAAACGLGSVLVRGSCAAEDMTEDQNALLIDENADSMAAKLRDVLSHPASMRTLGDTAMETLYLSWKDAVAHADERYQIVIDRYRCGGYPAHSKPTDEFFRSAGMLMEALSTAEQREQQFRREARLRLQHDKEQLEQRIKADRQQAEQRIQQAYEDFWDRYR